MMRAGGMSFQVHRFQVYRIERISVSRSLTIGFVRRRLWYIYNIAGTRDPVPVSYTHLPDLLEAQRRIFSDNTTTAIAGHTYMSAWPSWPLLVRPVWYLFRCV